MLDWLPWLPRIRTRRTFVVLGCPRGGTSLIAGALDAAGVYMGDLSADYFHQYEDPAFKIPPNKSDLATGLLAPVIRQRNRRHRYWGWKVPNSIYYIRHVRDLLIAPCYLFVYRDPLDIARSSARHDQRDWTVEGEYLLRVANTHTRLVRDFQETLEADHHVFQLEAIQSDPAAFVDDLAAILRPLRPDRERLLRFIDRGGGYHPLPD